MGILSSLFRILHPVHYAKRRIKRAIVPRPIRRAKWIAGGVVHPISRVKYSTRRAVIRKVDKAITPRKRKASRRVAARSRPVTHKLDYNDVKVAVAKGAGVSIERLRQFDALLAAGKSEEARQVFTNEEGQRIAAAYEQSSQLMRSIANRLASRRGEE